MNYLCTAGRIPGAMKMATIWLIPKTAQKPMDGRRKESRCQNGKQNFTG
nr:DNA-binding protein [Hungatella effluvii]